jgi:prepilin-type N-terminal cleavage/methylation domain-containing protein
MKSKQAGFTLIELVLCSAVLVVVVGAGASIYVIFHFISKFW